MHVHFFLFVDAVFVLLRVLRELDFANLFHFTEQYKILFVVFEFFNWLSANGVFGFFQIWINLSSLAAL